MKISDALLYIIHKNDKMTSADLLKYIQLLYEYKAIEICEDGMSFKLTNKGLDKLLNSDLI